MEKSLANNKPLVSIHLLNWNYRKYVDSILGSIKAQTYPNLDVLFIDNASDDGSYEYAQEKYPEFRYLKNDENLGYAGGHNVGLAQTRGEYVVLLNFDIVLKPDFIDKLVAVMEANPELGSAACKLYTYDFKENRFTDRFDSTGIEIFRSRRYRDRGQGEQDQGQYDDKLDILGPSGAVPIYRTAALQDVYENHGEYFDNDFFAYLEDIDLAWRLQHRGWKSRFVPEAVAGHERHLKGKTKSGFAGFRENRQQQSLFLRRMSTRNHYWLFWKNERCPHFWKDFIYLVVREKLLIAYQIFFEPKAFLSLFSALAKTGIILTKRRKIMETRKADWKEIAQLFSSSKRFY
ncbi:glycosyltransferase family 2 protein [Patescibacteria group bacterium]